MKKPQIGQTLYRLPINNRRRGVEPTLTPVVVKSVGRKYFTVHPEGDEWNGTKHHIDSGLEVSDYTVGKTLYHAEQEYRDEVDLERLNSKLREAFQYFGPCKFTLEQLRAVTAILFPSKEAP